jgi:hypothetical protein
VILLFLDVVVLELVLLLQNQFQAMYLVVKIVIVVREVVKAKLIIVYAELQPILLFLGLQEALVVMVDMGKDTINRVLMVRVVLQVQREDAQLMVEME